MYFGLEVCYFFELVVYLFFLGYIKNDLIVD